MSEGTQRVLDTACAVMALTAEFAAAALPSAYSGEL